MIRSSRHILKFATNNKLSMLELMFQDTEECVEFYIDLIIKEELPLLSNLSSKVLPDFKNFGGRYKQLLYKHASEIIRSQIQAAEGRRYKRYKYLYNKYVDTNKMKFFTCKKFKELKLKNILKSKYFSKPDLQNFSLNLDERFTNLKTESKHFDEFLQLFTPYIKAGTKRNRVTVNLPIKQHKHSLKYSSSNGWIRKNTVRILKINSNFYIEFIYEKQEPEKRTEGSSLGIDIGYKKLIACSDNSIFGINLEQIYTKLSNKKRNSKNYTKALTHKKQEINRVCNQVCDLLYLNKIKHLVLEDLKSVKHGSKFSKKFNNKLQYWSYLQVLNKLGSICEENGVLLTKVNPAYTSQTCSCCKNIDKKARNGETYSCSKCNLKIDADINASINILHRGIYSSSTTKSVLSN